MRHKATLFRLRYLLPNQVEYNIHCSFCPVEGVIGFFMVKVIFENLSLQVFLPQAQKRASLFPAMSQTWIAGVENGRSPD